MSITVDLDRVKVFLDEVKTEALIKATRQAMNRSVMSLRSQVNSKIREERKLGLGEINRDYLVMKKATGRDLGHLTASLEVSGRPLSLIRFVVGNRYPADQKGVPVAERKRVRVEVKPGRKVTLISAFIARGRGGNTNVFRRRGKKSQPIVKQSAPSLANIIGKPEFAKPLEQFAQAKFGAEFDSAFKFQLEKLYRKGEK